MKEVPEFLRFWVESCISICVSINHDNSIIRHVQAVHISSRRSIYMHSRSPSAWILRASQGQHLWRSDRAHWSCWRNGPREKSEGLLISSKCPQFSMARIDFRSCGKTLEKSTCSNDQPGVCIIGTFSTNSTWNVGETYYKKRFQHQLRKRRTNPIVALSKPIDWAMSRLPSKELSAVLSKWTLGTLGTSEYRTDVERKLFFPQAKQGAVSKEYWTWQCWGLIQRHKQ